MASVGGVVAGAAGSAGAADVLNGGTIAAASAPAIASTGSNQAAGNLTLTIPAGSTITAGDTINLTVSDSGSATGNGTICYAGVPAVSSTGINVTTTAAGTTTHTCTVGTTDTITITLGADTGAAAATVSVTGIAYDTSGATGTLGVYATLLNGTSAVGNFSPYPVANGTLPATPPAAPAAMTLTAASTPSIGVGQAAQPAGDWNLAVSATSTTQGWVQGNQVAVVVNDSAATNCVGNEFLLFSALPTVTVTTTNFGTAAAPTVTPVLAYTTPCGPNQSNTLLLQFTNSGTFPATNATFTVNVSGVQYTTGTATATGNIKVGATYETGGAAPVAVTGAPAITVTNAPNANVAKLIVTANNPAVSTNPSALGVAISPITLTEASVGQVPPGWVCVTLSQTNGNAASVTTTANGQNAFSAASTPSVSVTAGNASVSTTAPTITTSTAANSTTDNTVAFQVTVASSGTSPATIVLKGLSVNVGAVTTGAVTALVATGQASSSSCTGTPTTGLTATAYTVTSSVQRIYGATADATAAAEFQHEFPPGTACPGGANGFRAGGFGPTGTSPVVLATDATYADALSGAYLARYLGTGELLTPSTSLSTDTLTALRLDGINQVYVVGGPLAITAAVVSQLQSTPAYYCGGTTAATSLLGTAVDLSVTRIYGQTAAGTAADIAQYPPASYVAQLSFYGAYAGTNSNKGTGMYNDTSGTGSAAPASTAPLPTAILATSSTYQDAMSGSTLAYAQRLPILLTDPTSLPADTMTAIQALGIHQVVLMGGPLAVTDAVVTQLQGMGVSVLRVAGTDYTDTATQLASFEANATAGDGLGWTLPTGLLTVARGDFYTDGLAGAVVAANGGVAYTNANAPLAGAKTDPVATTTDTTATATCGLAGSALTTNCATPMILTLNPTSIGTYLPTFLSGAGTTGISGNTNAKVGSFIVLGGPLAVTPTVVSELQAAL